MGLTTIRRSKDSCYSRGVYRPPSLTNASRGGTRERSLTQRQKRMKVFVPEKQYMKMKVISKEMKARIEEAKLVAAPNQHPGVMKDDSKKCTRTSLGCSAGTGDCVNTRVVGFFESPQLDVARSEIVVHPHLKSAFPSVPRVDTSDVGLVYAITDRKYVDGRTFYRVQWRDELDGYRWPDSWLLGSQLREDGFESACKVVDAWKSSRIALFYDYCRDNGHVRAIGDSAEGTCAVVAVEAAVTLLGNSSWASNNCFKEFVRFCCMRGRPISSEGLTTGELRRYIKFGNDRCFITRACQISVRAFDTNLLGGVNGKHAPQVLVNCVLEDGVYVCAAFSSLRVTHCFALRVLNGSKTVYDDESAGVGVETYDMKWIVGIVFLRSIKLYVS